MMRQNTSKKIQNVDHQKLILVKNYLEQELETQGYRGHVRYDRTNKTLIQYRIKEGTIAIIKNGKLAVFEIPVKKFLDTAMPLEFKSIDLNSINIENVTYCKKCKDWKKQAGITHCRCGKYMSQRKRFSTVQTESWDEEFLEIQFAKADIQEAERIERIKSGNKTKKYIPTGITPKLAGISSVQNTETVPRMELLLIPKGDELREIQVMSVESCSLLWVAAISSTSQGTSKMDLLKKYNLEMVDFDEQSSKNRKFVSETKRFIVESSPQVALELIDSWNHPTHNTPQRQSKTSERTKKSRLRRNVGLQQKFIEGKYAKYSKKTYKHKPMFASSLPIPEKNQKVEVTN